MKQIGKDKMQEVAKEVFGKYPNAKKVAVVSDGQAFIIDNGDAAAKNHAKNNIYGKELSVVTFLRDDVMQKAKGNKADGKTDKKTAAELIADIETAETIEAVKAILGKDKRTTVVAAAKKRISELKEDTESGDTEGAGDTTDKDNVDAENGSDSNPQNEE